MLLFMHSISYVLGRDITDYQIPNEEMKYAESNFTARFTNIMVRKCFLLVLNARKVILSG